MKKLLLLSFIVLLGSSSFAQNPFLIDSSGATVPANHIIQTDDGSIGIGTDYLAPAQGEILRVTNHTSYPSANTPYIISLVANEIASGSWPTANTPYSFAVARVPQSVSGPDGPVDFMVDGYGNTGIGIMDPASKLHIFNDPRASGYYPNSFQVDRPILASVGYGPSVVVAIRNDMMISADGLTGIGVAAPAAHLDIADQNNDGQPLLRATAHGGTDAALHIAANGVVTVGGSTTTSPGLSGTVFKIKGAGYCEGNMWVNGTTATTHLWLSAGAASGYVLQSDALGNASWVDPGTLGSSLWASSGSDIYNVNSGLVRMGAATAFPTYSKLMIQSSGAIDLVNPGSTGWGSIIQFYDNAGTVRHRIYDDFGPTSGTSSTNGDLVIEPGSGKLWVNGGVKIGNLPAITSGMDNKYMLYVEKGILTEKVKVALTAAGNWSDYVFDKGYKLRKLEDVQAYIKDHHHLPDVPSAKDVYTDGIDMAQMDATLLRKIEELTLYVLDLKKENEEIKKQLKQSK